MEYDVPRLALITKTMLPERLCPLCKIPFMEIPLNEWSVGICEKCEGMFFEYDEMSAVLAAPSDGIFKEMAYGDGKYDRNEPIECPACGSKMEEKEYAGSKVHVDQCVSCTGIFLDGGEAEAVNRYLTSLESPDVEKARDDEYEIRYQDALVKMAEDMYANITSNS